MKGIVDILYDLKTATVSRRKEVEMSILKSLDKLHASEELIQDTLKYCKTNGKQDKSHKNVIPIKKRLAIAGIASVLIVLSTGSVFAFNSYVNNGRYKAINTAQNLDHLEGVTDENGNTYQYDQTQDMNQTIENKNLTVTFVSYVADTNKVIFKVEVCSTDGSAINEMNDNRVAVIARDKFRNITITVDGQEVELPGIHYDGNNTPSGAACRTQRVDKGADPARAQFEITYEDYSRELSNANIGITLNEYISDYTDFEEIDFIKNNVAELFENVTLATEDAFTSVNSTTGGDKSVQLARGDMHIKFCNQYPDAYIDNAGYIADPVSAEQRQMFVMTIVPGSESETSELMKLVFQNQSSGYAVVKDRRLLDDGRIQIAYSYNTDSYFEKTAENSYQDTTNEQLSNITLKKIIIKSNVQNESEYDPYTTVSDGTWGYQMAVTSGDSNKPIEKTLDTVVNDSYYQGMFFIAKDFKLTTTTLTVKGTATPEAIAASEKGLMSSSGAYSPVITMKNGTVFGAGDKCSGAGQNAIQDYTWTLPTVINVNDVASVSWHGTVLYTAE